jgi:outer membrane immunogenic protein
MVFGRMAAQGAWMFQKLKLVLTAGALLGFGATDFVSAADMAVKARPVVAPLMYNWQGCYIGANVGGGWARTDSTQVLIDPAIAANSNFGRETDTSFIGGGQAGCDFMAGKDLVFGIEGTFDFGNINGQHVAPDVPALTISNSVKSIMTAGGRIGYLWTPQFMTYAKGGMAWMQNRSQILTTGTGVLNQSSNFWLPGMDVGLGGEYMFTPNWSVFAEWNYLWIEDQSGQHYNPATPVFNGSVFNVKQIAQTVLVGVNYKFHWDAPVVAKY